MTTADKLRETLDRVRAGQLGLLLDRRAPDRLDRLRERHKAQRNYQPGDPARWSDGQPAKTRKPK